jgi:hypothetical protein
MPILSGADALDPERGFDYVVAYPHSSNIYLDHGELQPRLSVLSRMSIEAAAAVWKSQPGGHLVIPGETLFPSLSNKNSTALMACCARQKTGLSDLELITLNHLGNGRPLNNTYLQTEAVATALDQPFRKGGSCLIETLDYHLERVMWTARKYEIKGDFVAAEDVLQAAGIHEYEDCYPFINAGTKNSERLAKLLARVDRHARAANRITEYTGGRVVDVIFDADKKPNGFLNTTAKKRQAVMEGAQRIVAAEAA